MEKHIEERFGRYTVFGVHPDGRVDLASPKNSTLATVTPEEADVLIAERDAAVDMIWKLAQALEAVAPETLTGIWYGKWELTVKA